jgi:uncharacterized protein (DUF433 family)
MEEVVQPHGNSAMNPENSYQHLEPRPGSNYRQWFVKGRRIRAEVLYRQTIGEDPRTPEEVAKDYNLPLEAVLEAIDYCIRHADVLQEDRDREAKHIEEDEQRKSSLSSTTDRPQ